MVSPVAALLLENFALIGTHLRHCDGGQCPTGVREIALRGFKDPGRVRTLASAYRIVETRPEEAVGHAGGPQSGMPLKETLAPDALEEEGRGG